MRDGVKLVAFDLDGVLVEDPGSWHSVHAGLGTLPQAEESARAFLLGELSFEEWAQTDVKLWLGVPREKIKGILDGVPYIRGVRETLPALAKKYKLAIISSGLGLLADRVRDEFSLDYCVANRLTFDGGLLSGVDTSLDFMGKGEALRKVAAEFDLEPNECAAVGDYDNDVPMFKEAGYALAFNPKTHDVKAAADDVIEDKDLARILNYL